MISMAMATLTSSLLAKLNCGRMYAVVIKCFANRRVLPPIVTLGPPDVQGNRTSMYGSSFRPQCAIFLVILILFLMSKLILCNNETSKSKKGN